MRQGRPWHRAAGLVQTRFCDSGRHHHERPHRALKDQMPARVSARRASKEQSASPKPLQNALPTRVNAFYTRLGRMGISGGVAGLRSPGEGAQGSPDLPLRTCCSRLPGSAEVRRAAMAAPTLSSHTVRRMGASPSSRVNRAAGGRSSQIRRTQRWALVVIDFTGGRMQKKVFWLTFTALGLLADFTLPLKWGIAATLPIMGLSWWIAYRSGWF